MKTPWMSSLYIFLHLDYLWKRSSVIFFPREHGSGRFNVYSMPQYKNNYLQVEKCLPASRHSYKVLKIHR